MIVRYYALDVLEIKQGVESGLELCQYLSRNVCEREGGDEEK